jgi:hypothetical protein
MEFLECVSNRRSIRKYKPDLIGDELFEKIRSMNGWSWVRKIDNNDEGWVPNETIEINA